VEQEEERERENTPLSKTEREKCNESKAKRERIIYYLSDAPDRAFSNSKREHEKCSGGGGSGA
jgi:hypothetical protein